MSATREVSFSGGTVLLVEPTSGNMSFSVRSAVPVDGVTRVAVDWGDGDVEFVSVVGGTVPLSHEYRSPGEKRIRISDDLAEFRPSGFDGFSSEGLFEPSNPVNLHTGARPLKRIVSLGSAVANRVLEDGLFANTSITEIPSAYSAPALVPENPASKVVPRMCFYGTNLASLDGLPANVRAIDDWAFRNCTSLIDVSRLSSCDICHVGTYAFAGCTSLVDISPLSISGSYAYADTTIPDKLFRGTWSGSLSYIDQIVGALHDRNRINRYLMPLGVGAFSGCTSLTTHALRAGLPLLNGTFAGCTSLTGFFSGPTATAGTTYYSTTVSGHPTDMAVYYSVSAYLYYSGSTRPQYHVNSGGAFAGSGITSAGSGVERAGILAGEFSGCLGLTTVTIGQAVVCIGSGAFSGCDNLSVVNWTSRTKDFVRNSVVGLTGPGYVGVGTRTYPFGLRTGCVIHCSDGDIVV